MSASHLGELVNTAGVRARARVIQDSWWIPRVIGPELESHGRSGQHHGPPDKSTRRPGELVDPTGTWTWAQGAQDRWSTPPALGHWPELSGTTGRHPGPSEPDANHRESWSNLRAIGPEAESPGRDGRLRRPSNPGPSCRDSGWTPRGLGTGLESTGRAVPHRRRSHPGASLPGELVKPAGTRSRAQVARGLWSISHNLGHISESPATAGRFRLLRTRARDARGSCSTPRAIGL